MQYSSKVFSVTFSLQVEYESASAAREEEATKAGMLSKRVSALETQLADSQASIEAETRAKLNAMVKD